VATDADVLSIRVHQARVKEEEIQRQAEVSVSRAALNDAMGISLDDAAPLSTPLSPAAGAASRGGLQAQEVSAVAERPELRQAKLAREMADLRARDARAAYLPEVGVRGVFEADRQRAVTRGGANWLVSIGLRWNLFDGFANQARVKEAEAVKRQSAADHTQVESAARLQVRQAWAHLSAARQRIETASASTAEAEESLRISQNRYAAGLATVSDLLRTENALLESRTRRLEAVHGQRLAAAMLAYAAGTLTIDSEVFE
jgi:outer membrane protein TolC